MITTMHKEEQQQKNVGRSYHYYDLLVAAFVAVVLCSNLIGAGKAAEID